MNTDKGYRLKTIYDNKIEQRLEGICKKQGELYYVKIKHPVYENYSELDIVTKKLLLKDMNNIVIFQKASAKKNIIIITSDINLHNLLMERDHITTLPMGIGNYSGKIARYNEILHKNTEWYKLYVKNEDGELRELNFDKIKSNTLNGLLHLRIYLTNYAIKYAMEMGYKVPLLDINNDIRITLSELYSTFTSEEIQYLKEYKDN